MKLPIPFGNYRSYPGHSGVDFGQPRGTPIPASGPGKISHRGTSTRGGCYIWVRYDNGPLVGYHHMDTHGGCPPDGSRVTEGTRLGYVGSRGSRSTGPHLHSEISGEATTAGYWRYFDRTRVVGAKPAGGDTTHIDPDEPQKRVNTMTTLYRRENVSPGHYALAGDSPGTPANWLETRDGDLALEWARNHGSSVLLSAATFDWYRDLYRGPVTVNGGTAIDETKLGQTIGKAVADAVTAALATTTAPPADLTSVLDAVANIPKAVNDDAAARLAN